MTPHLTHDSTGPRRCSRFASLCPLRGQFLRTLSLMVGVGGSAEFASAEPPAPPAPSRPAGVADAMAARSVLMAIEADPELRGVHLAVSVVNGVAVIGGPVSSPAVSKRAELVVRQVSGIKEVKNGCFVTSGPDALMKAVAERLGNRTAPPSQTAADLPGVLTGPQSAPALPGTSGYPSGNMVASGPRANTVVANKPALPSNDAPGLLGPPVGPAGSSSAPMTHSGRDNAVAPGKLTGGTPGLPVDILTSAGNVKNAEVRFASLAVELKDGVLVIGGTTPRPSDAWDLADKLRRIPGVSRVVVAVNQGGR
jgi:hypothetical protein